MTPPLPDSLVQIVRLYLSVIDAASRSVEPMERDRAIQLARQWAPNEPEATIEAIVDTAYVASRAGQNVEEIAQDLSRRLLPEDFPRLLADLGRIAQADGHLTVQEARTISTIRSALS